MRRQLVEQRQGRGTGLFQASGGTVAGVHAVRGVEHDDRVHGIARP
jgi:hypothetical protein